MPDPLNAVVDLSHHNGNVNLQQAKGAGIIGVAIDPAMPEAPPLSSVERLLGRNRA